MTETEKKAFCPEGVINGVDCETITGQPWFDTNQILTCDARDGLNCDNSINFGDLCKDYRIRYQCQVICKGKYCKSLNYQFFYKFILGDQFKYVVYNDKSHDRSISVKNIKTE